MEFYHRSVLLNECIEMLNIKPDGIYVDCTLGGAGHSSEILAKLSEQGLLVAFDQDINAIRASKDRLQSLGQNFLLIHKNFSQIKDALRENSIEKADGILMDLGVSSHQLDEAERGFSYQKDAPLDMRMDRRSSLTAETIVNDYDENQIKSIIRDYGEERWAARIAAFIARERNKSRIKTTAQLTEIIKMAIPAAARREGPHPAKRTFQAIRIAVNNELGILENAIMDSVDMLESGGRLCIITFHSLEDRIVKNTFSKLEKPCICPPAFPVCTCGRVPAAKPAVKKPIIPSDSETESNPRARSAKLRVLEKI